MTASKKHLAPKPRGNWSYIYDGRDLACMIQHQADGWHLLNHPQGELVGVYPTRQMALAMANARIACPPSAPIPGERERDAKAVKQIRKRQRQAQTRAAETCRAPVRGVIQAGKHRRLVDNKPEGTGSRVSGQDGERQRQ